MTAKQTKPQRRNAKAPKPPPPPEPAPGEAAQQPTNSEPRAQPFPNRTGRNTK